MRIAFRIIRIHFSEISGKESKETGFWYNFFKNNFGAHLLLSYQKIVCDNDKDKERIPLFIHESFK